MKQPVIDLTRLKPNGVPIGTFFISINDGYVEYEFPLVLPQSLSIRQIATVIFMKLVNTWPPEGRIRRVYHQIQKESEEPCT